LLGHTKIDSTVLYLRTAVEERINIQSLPQYVTKQTWLAMLFASSTMRQSISANGMNPPSLLTLKIAAQAAACGTSKMSGASPTSAARARVSLGLRYAPSARMFARKDQPPSGPETAS
jgi:hypothetical protein